MSTALSSRIVSPLEGMSGSCPTGRRSVPCPEWICPDCLLENWLMIASFLRTHLSDPSPAPPFVQLRGLTSQRKASNTNGGAFEDGSSLKTSLKQDSGQRQGVISRDSDSAPFYQIPALSQALWHLLRGCGPELKNTVNWVLCDPASLLVSRVPWGKLHHLLQTQFIFMEKQK